MKKAELKSRVAATGSYFFTRKTMSFFGDTMKNYGIRELSDCYELYRKKPVKHGLMSSAYFDKITFARIHGRA
jgi:hypothetical protein